MNFNGSYELNSNIYKVWENLNNPEVLKECIDGCSEFLSTDNSEYKAKINIKLGPVNAFFNSKIKITNIKPFEGYEIQATGNAGNLGFASGNVKVLLQEINNKTILKYEAEIRVNGKLAQLGSRLIDGSVKKNTEKFFNNFRKTLIESNTTIIDKDKNTKLSNSYIKVFSFMFIVLILILVLLGVYA